MNSPTPAQPATTSDDKIAATSFAAYSEYNKTLRTWLVAFGIGGPSLFMVNSSIATTLAKSGSLRLVVVLFLVGTALQVLGAALNKFCNWYVYQAYAPEGTRGTLRYKVSEWFTSQIWIDAVIDLGCIAAYGYALWLLFTVFA
jgi:hypothetical protein